MRYLNLYPKDKENFVKLNIRDITSPKEELEREFYNKNKKQTVPFTYYSPKQFDEFIKNQEERKTNPVKAKVLGNVKIYRKKYSDIKENQEFTEFIEQRRKKKIFGSVAVRYTKQYIEKHENKLKGETFKKYDLYETKDCRCYGYAEVGENEYVRLVKRNPLFFVLIGILCLGLLFGAGLLIKDKVPEIIDLMEIDDTVDANGKNNSGDDSQVIADTYEIPYMPKVQLSEDEPDLYLINPKGNSVYFMYTLFIDENGNGAIDTNEAVDVYTGKSKAFYQTKLIPPGQMVEADLYSILGKGEYRVVQKINAYNYAPGEEEDQSQCNGSNLTTLINIV